MRARIFGTLVLCLLGCLAVRNSAQEKSDVDTTIRALESKWVDVYEQRQSVAMAALFAEDYVITLEDGSTYGKVGFISYTARPMRVDLAELTDVKVHIHENTAVVIAGYHERGVLDGKSYDYRDRLTDCLDENRRQVAAHRVALQLAVNSLIERILLRLPQAGRHQRALPIVGVLARA